MTAAGESDTAATLARLAEQIASLNVRISGEHDLTDAKFVTFRTLIDSQAEKVALALSAADKAVTKAELATEKRFEGVNEFRAQLNDQARTFMPRTEADISMQRMAERIQELTDRMNLSEGHGAGTKDNKAGIYAAVAAVGVLVTIVVVVANLLT